MDESPDLQHDDVRPQSVEDDNRRGVPSARVWPDQNDQIPGGSDINDPPSAAVQATLSLGDQIGAGPQLNEGPIASDDSTSQGAEPESGAAAPSGSGPGGQAQAQDVAAGQPFDTSVLDGELARMAAAVEGFNDRAAAQEDLISRLHDRVQVLQAGETKHLLKPIINGLVGLHSELAVQARSVTRELSVEEVVGLLDVLAVRVVNTLSGLGMEPFAPAPGDSFNGRFHQAIVTVPTGAARADKQIAAVLRPGFADPSEKRIAFPAQVSVFKFDPAMHDSTNGDTNGSAVSESTEESSNTASSPEGSPR